MKVHIYLAHGAPPVVIDKIAPEELRGLADSLTLALRENRLLVVTSSAMSDLVVNPTHVVSIVPF